MFISCESNTLVFIPDSSPFSRKEAYIFFKLRIACNKSPSVVSFPRCPQFSICRIYSSFSVSFNGSSINFGSNLCAFTFLLTSHEPSCINKPIARYLRSPATIENVPSLLSRRIRGLSKPTSLIQSANCLIDSWFMLHLLSADGFISSCFT